MVGRGQANQTASLFFDHLALDYSLTFAQQYTLRDITKSMAPWHRCNQWQVIWTCPDPKNTINLSLEVSNSLGIWGLIVNFSAPTIYGPLEARDTHNKRVFVAMHLQDVVASTNFVQAVTSLIDKSPKRDNAEIPEPTVIGVPSAFQDSVYATSSYLGIAIFQLKPSNECEYPEILEYKETATFIDMNRP